MRVYKLAVMVVDHDELGSGKAVARELENARFGNDCIRPDVMDIESVEIDWHERHPINITKERKGEFKRLFPAKHIWTPIEECGELGHGVWYCKSGGYVGKMLFDRYGWRATFDDHRYWEATGRPELVLNVHLGPIPEAP